MCVICKHVKLFMETSFIIIIFTRPYWLELLIYSNYGLKQPNSLLLVTINFGQNWLRTLAGFFLISKFLVSPKEREAIVGFSPKVGSSSECQATLSCPSLYRFANIELNIIPVTSSNLSFSIVNIGLH